MDAPPSYETAVSSSNYHGRSNADTDTLPPWMPNVLSAPQDQSSESNSRNPFDLMTDDILLRILSQFTLIELHHNIRKVNRRLFKLSMHLLRSAFLQSYTTQVRPNYSCDPLGIRATNPNSHIQPRREVKALDLFITASVLASLRSSESSLHLFTMQEFQKHLIRQIPEPDSDWKDIFDLIQPKTRLEDLFIGLLQDFQRNNGDNKSYLSSPCMVINPQDITAKWSIKSIAILLPFTSSTVHLRSAPPASRIRTKTVIECSRNKSQPIETLAANLLQSLKTMVLHNFERHQSGHVVWYTCSD